MENKRVHFNGKRIWDKREETSCGVQGAEKDMLVINDDGLK